MMLELLCKALRARRKCSVKELTRLSVNSLEIVLLHRVSRYLIITFSRKDNSFFYIRL